ncbi:MAG: tetratricopeptide repeat protein [Lachnospiraceae bacterium]|nr:tetratricopeptide repeat protein [Lachnospiraceae bacterium]MDO5551856.1 tetratricopeptide repeat protein [Lachnospiraceae bacterium]
MDYVKRNRQIANSYYNLGLEKAKIRDLTGAVECLKRSLRFDKYQMDARNLLGLIFYEMGETADALTQWVISMNLRPKDNPADHYLEEIQRKSGQLERESQMIRTYNQALWHAQNNNADLAVLQLARVVDSNPHFVKAHILLALIYMAREDYVKAGKSLYRVLQIDKNHPKAQWYMSIVKQNTGREEVEKKKLKNAFSHRQMQDDDIIIPPAYKENTGWGSILNITAGLIIGMLVIFFLVMPANTKSLNTAHNQELISYSQKLSDLNQQLTVKTEEYDSLKVHADEMEAQLSSIESDNQAVIDQYQTIIHILQAYRSDDLMTIAQLYTTLDASLITDSSVLEIVNAITQDMTTNGYQTLEDLGTASWNGGNLEGAVPYYEKSLEVKPDNTAAMYLLGRVYQELGNTEQANQWFGTIIDQYPESSQAEQAREARGY